MGKKLRTAVDVTILVAYIVWLAVSLVCWIGGLVMFIWYINQVDSEGNPNNGFVGWLIWGIWCVIPAIRFFIKEVLLSTKKGAIQGANTYTTSVSVSSSSVSVRTRNHPILYAILGFVIGAFMGVLFGPIVALGIIIRYIIKTVKQVKVVRAGLPAKKPAPKKEKVASTQGEEEEPKEVVDEKQPTPKGVAIPIPVIETKKTPRALEVKKNEDSDEAFEVMSLKLFGKDFSALAERFQQNEAGEMHARIGDCLELARFQIVTDSISKKTLLRLQGKNISPVKIKSICVDIVCFDETGAKLGAISGATIECSPFGKDECGFEESGIIIPDKCAIGEIAVKRVTFEDGLYYDGEAEKASFVTAAKSIADMSLYLKAHQGRR